MNKKPTSHPEVYMNESVAKKPDNYLPLSILGTIVALCSPFCCLLGVIPGIIAIIFSLQVNPQYHEGKYESCLKSSANAKTFAIIALVIGGLGFLYIMGSYFFLEDTGTLQYYQDLFNDLKEDWEINSSK